MTWESFCSFWFKPGRSKFNQKYTHKTYTTVITLFPFNGCRVNGGILLVSVLLVIHMGNSCGMKFWGGMLLL